MNPFDQALILTGPTGCGKTALGVRLAERLGAEIVVMDSMTLYRGMDIGTAKPDAEQRRRVPHHLLDVLEPWESGSVAWWLEQAAACCRAIASRGKRPLLVGGTALYLKALWCGLFDGPPADPAVRHRLTCQAECEGREALHAQLARVDPVAAGRLHVNDIRRVIRALEVWELTGRPISDWQTQWQPETPRTAGAAAMAVAGSAHPVLWLDLPRPELYARINARVRQMVAAGWAEEVRRLQALPRPVSREAAQALGYAEMVHYVAGQATLEETIVRIQTRSRQFAKRQLTWLRHLPVGQPVAKEELTFAIWAS